MSNLVKQQSAFLLDVCRLIQFAHAHDFSVTGGELFRTKEQQELYVTQGKSKTMNSRHLMRLAIDLHFFKDGNLVEDKQTLLPLGAFWRSLDSRNQWGGFWENFVDLPHFERAPE